MRRWAAISALTFFLLTLAGPLWGQSPFKNDPGEQAPTVSQEPGVIGAALIQINLWQRQLNRQMVALGHEVRRSGNLAPVLSLMGLALLYGLAHAAGPGHGRVVTLSYVMTRGRLGAALAVGNLVALVHGLSGIALVLAVKLVLEVSLRGALAQTTVVTQLVSYGLLAVLGGMLLARGLWSWRAEQSGGKPVGRDVPPWLMALAAGMVPCPGVVVVMLFCLAQDMAWLGALMALAMSLGMALTISAAAAAAYFGKTLSLRAVAGRPAAVDLIRRFLEAGAALALLILGLVLLAAVLYGNSGAALGFLE